MSRNQAVGVVVDPAVWEVVESVAAEVLEDLLIAEQWGERIDHQRSPAKVGAPQLKELLEADGASE